MSFLWHFLFSPNHPLGLCEMGVLSQNSGKNAHGDGILSHPYTPWLETLVIVAFKIGLLTGFIKWNRPLLVIRLDCRSSPSKEFDHENECETSLPPPSYDIMMLIAKMRWAIHTYRQSREKAFLGIESCRIPANRQHTDQSGPISHGKKCFCMKSTTRKWSTSGSTTVPGTVDING